MNTILNNRTTGVACINTNRNFIGMELDDKYFEIAEARINEALDEKRKKDLQAGTNEFGARYFRAIHGIKR